ncbi:MAG: helix-turn-helix transcriptional regulator [Prevotella sp.]|nr:helix-turn-helix transcriptional regulator [Prevotella sp.]
MESLRPVFSIAIVDSNILSALGLQQILTDMAPMVDIRIFVTFSELEVAKDRFVHYFVASRIYFEHASFFRTRLQQTIVLVNGDMQIQGVATLNVCQSEKMVVKSIITLQRQGHHDSNHRMSTGSGTVQLSPREVEVTILLTMGLINKEIADRLNISVTTVITHRKNIMEKLHARSLADIIIYAVMNGYVNLGEL